MNNKIFIENGCRYLIWWRVSIVAYVIIYCENLNIVVRANYLEGTIKTVWIGPMAQSEDINQSEDGQINL